MSCFPCLNPRSKDIRIDIDNGSRTTSRHSADSSEHKKGSDEGKGSSKGSGARSFTFRELATATRNFRETNLLGEGVFGRVFKGRLETGEPPCCSPNDTACGLSEVCKDCTTCFRHSDLHNDRPSTAQFREKLPWFLNSLPSADCSKGGRGAYTTSVELQGYENGIVKASSFRTYHTPLNKQVDYVNSMRVARQFASRVSDSLKMEIFPYSVIYMFFEQYLDIWKTALINIAIAIGAVFIVCLGITCSLWTSAIIMLVLAMILVDLMGVMAILGIQLNAVSVVNLVMSVGIAVEFCVHITHAFSVSSGNRDERVKEALGTMGASFTLSSIWCIYCGGITLTKLVGVLVLCFSKTEVFVVYHFQMYLALVLLGFLHGLVFLPVVLSMFGPPSRCIKVEKQDERPSVSSQP